MFFSFYVSLIICGKKQNDRNYDKTQKKIN